MNIRIAIESLAIRMYSVRYAWIPAPIRYRIGYALLWLSK
jgi:hypothetical protein